jgi:quercetin dioxygenase-like cupin family protein
MPIHRRLAMPSRSSSGTARIGGIGLGLAFSCAITPVLQRPCLAFETGHGGEAQGVVVETLARSSRDWSGALLPPYPGGQPQVSVLRITIPPGVRLAPHHHPVINAGVLLQGRLKVVIEAGQSKVLRAGDAIIEMVNRKHHGESLGPEPAVIVMVYAGVEGLPITVRDGSSPTPSTTPSTTPAIQAPRRTP